MRKHNIASLIAAAAAAVLVCSCARNKEVEQDETPLTFLTAYGFGQEYTLRLAQKVKELYGIELEFITERSSDSASMMRLDFANDNMQADIVLTAQSAPDSLLKGSCINLQARSNLTDLFPYLKIRECTADDGGVYQLPFCSKLIGLTYNATLLKEMGWEEPRSYADMLSLKKKCEAAGILFAATDANLTGCGFNYLFHSMGSQWLSTLEGSEWFSAYLKGEASIAPFKEQCSFFRKWAENGLFGQPFAETGKAALEFKKQRALFFYGITNFMTSYQGPQFDASGKETGRMLNDEYKTMPWISEDGTNNCFTNYDAVWVMLNHKLLAPDKKDKLAKAIKVLEFIAKDDVQGILANRSNDVYLYLDGFKAGEDRLYSNYLSQIKNGYLQPWYYNYFDAASIVNTGAEINSYLFRTFYGDDDAAEKAEPSNMVYNPSATFDSIFEVLDYNNNNNNNNNTRGSKHFIGSLKQRLEYPETAKVCAVCYALSAQEILDKEFGDDAPTVQVGIIPYTKDLRDLDPWKPAAVVCSHMYPGPFELAHTNVIIPINTWRVNCFRMTGKEISYLLKKGYKGYPYAIVTKGGMKISDDAEYVVASSRNLLDDALVEEFEKNGRIIQNPRENRALMANAPHGLELFFELHPEVGPEDINW